MEVDEQILAKLQKIVMNDFLNLILGLNFHVFLVTSVDFPSWDDSQDLAQHVFNLDGCTFVGTVSSNMAGKTPALNGWFFMGKGVSHCHI